MTAIRGKTRCEPRSTSPSTSGSVDIPGVDIPDVGNQSSPAANMTISGMPMTKYGIEYRIRLPVPTRSAAPLRRQPV